MAKREIDIAEVARRIVAAGLAEDLIDVLGRTCGAASELRMRLEKLKAEAQIEPTAAEHRGL